MIRIHCDKIEPTDRIDLEIEELYPPEATPGYQAIRARLDACFDGLRINMCVGITGHELSTWAESLRKLHRGETDTAGLSSFDEDFAIQWTVLDRGSGMMRVDLSWAHPCRLFFDRRPDAMAPPFGNESRVTLAGGVTDQSYLPDLIRSIEAAIRERQISTRSPWDA